MTYLQLLDSERHCFSNIGAVSEIGRIIVTIFSEPRTSQYYFVCERRNSFKVTIPFPIDEFLQSNVAKIIAYPDQVVISRNTPRSSISYRIMDALANDYDPTINNSIHNHHFHLLRAGRNTLSPPPLFSQGQPPEAPDEAKRTHIVGIITACIARERGYYPGPDIGEGESVVCESPRAPTSPTRTRSRKARR